MTATIRVLSIHPVSRLFPPMNEDQFAALKDDIAQNGQREPITLWDHQVIDGAHRARACEELNLEPITRVWEGEESELTRYVVSLNLHRRHLNESQRAMVAEKITRSRSEGIAAGNHARVGSASPIGDTGKFPVREAAALLNVGTSSIGRARRVRESGVPELIAAVEAGAISAYTGSEIAKLPPAAQRQAVETPRRPAARNQFTNTTSSKVVVSERITRAVESLTNIAETLTESLTHAAGDKCRTEWAKQLRAVRTELSRFIAECER